MCALLRMPRTKEDCPSVSTMLSFGKPESIQPLCLHTTGFADTVVRWASIHASHPNSSEGRCPTASWMFTGYPRSNTQVLVAAKQA